MSNPYFKIRTDISDIGQILEYYENDQYHISIETKSGNTSTIYYHSKTREIHDETIAEIMSVVIKGEGWLVWTRHEAGE